MFHMLNFSRNIFFFSVDKVVYNKFQQFYIRAKEWGIGFQLESSFFSDKNTWKIENLKYASFGSVTFLVFGTSLLMGTT